jgi:NitT/TauT family transport system permease protein
MTGSQAATLSPPREDTDGIGAATGLLPRRRHTERRSVQVGFVLLSLVAMIAVWQLIIVVFDIKDFTLPPPAAVARTLVHSLPVLLPALGTTLEETGLGFGIATAVGVLLACAIASSRVVEQLMYPVLVVSNAVPKIALAPIFIAWLGLGSAPRVVMAAMLAVFPIVISTVVGLVGVDEGLLLLGRSTRAGRWRVFRLIRLPGAVPSILGGLKVGSILALTGAVVGELVGGNTGLGYIIIGAQGNLLLSLALAAIVLLAAVGVVLFYLIELIGKLVDHSR